MVGSSGRIVNPREWPIDLHGVGWLTYREQEKGGGRKGQEGGGIEGGRSRERGGERKGEERVVGGSGRKF